MSHTHESKWLVKENPNIHISNASAGLLDRPLVDSQTVSLRQRSKGSCVENRRQPVEGFFVWAGQLSNNMHTIVTTTQKLIRNGREDLLG